ncbi:MAG TPA: alkaline phosphatase family protein [Acidimicrobiia bacterium]|nr:alkaline phosphatase family protein [Acidimicrobiia bacterium]
MTGRSDSTSGVPRRDFLRAAGAMAGGVALGGRSALGALAPRARTPQTGPRGRLLDTQPSDCPIDTVVVVMMENRSFDHYLGWLGSDERYLDAGRSRWGSRFTVDGKIDLTYVDADGKHHKTRHLTRGGTEPHPYRGCGHPVPGHGWYAGRVELADGFLAAGTGNDPYAIGYYLDDDVPIHAHLARRFTVHDRSFASLLAGTFPNRQYLYTAQSGGQREDPVPLVPGMFTTPTIFDKLSAAQVPFTAYYTDLPLLALWDGQDDQAIRPADDYFEACASGTLANVVFLSPGFAGDLRTDDHSQGDVRLGQRFIREVFDAFSRSKHWERGLFVLTYDEWGGFFDHVKPPVLADDRASSNVENDFGLAGFRVPTIVASPYARRNYVDHRVYDHTSILRFLEWRFLGAPPESPGGTSTWNLTVRDRNANNVGASLGATRPDPELGFDLQRVEIGPYSLGCPADETVHGPALPEGEHPNPFVVAEEFRDDLERRYPKAAHTPWFDVPARS